MKRPQQTDRLRSPLVLDIRTQYTESVACPLHPNYLIPFFAFGFPHWGLDGGTKKPIKTRPENCLPLLHHPHPRSETEQHYSYKAIVNAKNSVKTDKGSES